MEQAVLERRVRVIPATKPAPASGPRHSGRQRVAAYCRVSTDSEEQLNSYAAQPRLGDGRDLRRRGLERHQHEKADGVQPHDRRLQAGPHRHDPHQVRLPVRPEHGGLP